MSLSDFGAEHRKTLRTVMIVALCALGVFGICYCVYFNIARNVFSLANCMLDLACLVFLTLLFAFSSDNDGKMKKQQRYFDLLVVSDFLMTFFSLLGNCVMYLPDCVFRFKLFNAFSYSFLALFGFALWLYQKEYSKSKTLDRVIMILLLVMAAAYVAVSFLNIFFPLLFSVDVNGGYDFSRFDFITVLVAAAYLILMYINIISADCPLKKKLAIASCEVTPAVALLISVAAGLGGWNVYLVSISDFAMMIPLYIIFFNVHIEQKKEMLRYETEQAELQAAVTVSQIQPHFLYNSLSVISALCDENPGLAGKATIDFAEYLRENLNYADSMQPIPFIDELNHIRKYIALEELRFPEKLKVEYDIACTDFTIPALSVQPLVNNAVKYGVCKSHGGGTVRISSREEENAYIVTVEDDGVGFDPSVRPVDGKKHIGIENAKIRVERMMGGTLTVRSAVGRGTTATIVIPKGGAAK
ncbi:MAG: histidine kinase [Clostridia bacterium]|nr:histidine kinase [Clostridia bacterium]